MENKTLIHSGIYYISTLFYLLIGNYTAFLYQNGFNWTTFIVLIIVFFVVGTFLDKMVEDKARQIYASSKRKRA